MGISIRRNSGSGSFLDSKSCKHTYVYSMKMFWLNRIRSCNDGYHYDKFRSLKGGKQYFSSYKTPVSQKVVKFTISANAANYGSSTTTLHFFKCGLILNQAGWVI